MAHATGNSRLTDMALPAEAPCPPAATSAPQAAERPRLGDRPATRPARYYVDLVRHLVRRDFTLHYQNSALGVLWSLLLPLTQLVVLVFLFQRVVPLGIDAYPAFVFSALLPWTWFSTCLSDAGPLFIQNRDLLRRPAFEPAVLVIVNMGSHLLSFLISIPLLLLLLHHYDRPLGPSLLLVPVVLVIQATLILGLGLLVATLNVFYRDVQHIVSVLLSLLFYLTPIFYRPQELSAHFRLIFELNPMAAVIDAYRAIWFEGRAPDATTLAVASAAAVAVCATGYVVYRRNQHTIIDMI